jgi:hypothetical protein
MTTPSIYHELNDKNAILTVFKDQMILLKPKDTFSAIGTYDLDGCSCLLGLGTTSGSAIVLARISHFTFGLAGNSHSESLRRAPSTTNHDEHYMSLVRKLVNEMMRNHELFQLPVVCGIFGQYKGEVLLEHLKERTVKVFRHLNITMRSSFYELKDMNGTQQPRGESTVVAAQHQNKMPELYIGNHLAHPANFSGSLASILEQLGLEHVGHDNRGNNREDDRDNGDQDEGCIPE